MRPIRLALATALSVPLLAASARAAPPERARPPSGPDLAELRRAEARYAPVDLITPL